MPPPHRGGQEQCAALRGFRSRTDRVWVRRGKGEIHLVRGLFSKVKIIRFQMAVLPEALPQQD